MQIDTSRALAVAHFLRALSVAEGNKAAALAFLEGQNLPERTKAAAVSQLKAATGGINGSGAVGAAALDLAALVWPMTVIGQLRGVRRASFNARLLGMTAATSAAWVAPGGSIPLSGVSFNAPEDLSRKMVGALAVTTNETLRDADPELQRTLVADLAGAIVKAMDAAFLDPANTGSASTSAAITTTGVTTSSLTGIDADAISTDLGELVETLAGEDLQTASWVLHPRTAAYLARLRGTGGALAFPGIGVNGGQLLGLPVVVSAGVPLSDDTAAETQVSLIVGSGVLLADSGETEITLSTAATLEMDSAPQGDSTNPTASSAYRVGLFQVDAAAIKAVRYANWLPRRATVAATLTGVPY